MTIPQQNRAFQLGVAKSLAELAKGIEDGKILVGDMNLSFNAPNTIRFIGEERPRIIPQWVGRSLSLEYSVYLEGELDDEPRTTGSV